jgi:hypothetical protein
MCSSSIKRNRIIPKKIFLDMQNKTLQPLLIQKIDLLSGISRKKLFSTLQATAVQTKTSHNKTDFESQESNIAEFS